MSRLAQHPSKRINNTNVQHFIIGVQHIVFSVSVGVVVFFISCPRFFPIPVKSVHNPQIGNDTLPVPRECIKGFNQHPTMDEFLSNFELGHHDFTIRFGDF